MIRGLLWMASLIVAPWLLIGGLVALALGTGVMEVLVFEVAALGFIMLGGLLLLDDVLGPRR